MKKTYIEPATRVVTAQMTQFLMTSTGTGVHGGSGYSDLEYGGLGDGSEGVD